MQLYIGTKRVKATPMNRLEYNTLRGLVVPANENPADDGYLVEYTDGGAPNMPGYAGYISWSPKEQFENAYKITEGMTFSEAVSALKIGHKVARTGWNGAAMFVFLVQGSVFKVNRPPLLGIYPENTEITYRPHIDIKTADGSIATWAPSNSDVLSDDWVIVN